jgi:medium-chain acyl-[acyl-carrier-protein] hydrolase
VHPAPLQIDVWSYVNWHKVALARDLEVRHGWASGYWPRPMDRTTPNKWLPFRSEDAVVRCRIFSFPQAAGNAAFYRPLRSVMPPEIDLCPVELPGRAARLEEQPFTSMSALMERLSRVLQPLMTVPFGFFGRGAGPWVAYEAARQLRSADGRTAVHLFVSSPGPPYRASADAPSASPRSDQDLLAILCSLGGTPTAVMQSPELITALLPALRADLAPIEAYTVDPWHQLLVQSLHLAAPMLPRTPATCALGEA